MIAALQSLHPARAGFDHRLRYGHGCVGEVRCVRALAGIFEQQGQFVIGQRTFPDSYTGDFSLAQRATEIRCRATYLKHVIFHIRALMACLISNFFAIQPQAGSTFAYTQHHRVRLAIVDLRTTTHGSKPPDVINQTAVTQEQSLRIRRPFSLWRAVRKQSAIALRGKHHHRGKIGTEIDFRIRKILRAMFR